MGLPREIGRGGEADGPITRTPVEPYRITPRLTPGEVAAGADRTHSERNRLVSEVLVSMSLTESAAASASRLRELRLARDATSTSREIRERQLGVDNFLADSSRHVMTLQAILVGAARRGLGDPPSRELATACHRLQVAMRAMHARRWGSSQLMRIPWGDIRREVDDCLDLLLTVEESVAAQLQARLTVGEVSRICLRLAEFELRAPTRPHPYLPHRGPGGRLLQRAISRSDAFWDGVQGRVVGAVGGGSS